MERVLDSPRVDAVTSTLERPIVRSRIGDLKRTGVSENEMQIRML